MKAKIFSLGIATIASLVMVGCQTLTPPDSVWDRAEQFRRKDPTVKVKIGDSEFTTEGGETVIELAPVNSSVCPGPFPPEPEIGPDPQPSPNVQPGPSGQQNPREREGQPPVHAIQPLWQAYFVGCYDCDSDWKDDDALAAIDEIESTFDISVGELLMEDFDVIDVVYAGMQDDEFPLNGGSDTVVILPWTTADVNQDVFRLTKRLEYVIPELHTYLAFHYGEQTGVLIIRGNFENSILRMLSLGITKLRVNDLMNDNAPNGDEDYLDVRRDGTRVTASWHTPGLPDWTGSVELRDVLDEEAQHYILE